MSRGRRLGVVLLVVAGLAVVLYPSAATWFNAREQARSIAAFARVVDGLPAEQRAAVLRAAHDYNDDPGDLGLTTDPFTSEVASDAPGVARYLSMLDISEVMARLRVPSIGVDLPVYHGTNEETLERGVGHLFGSSLPVGGASTHAVLTAHRGHPETHLFSDLDQVGVGDVIMVDVLGETLTYEVDQVLVVEPTDTEALRIEPEADRLTLITCTPYAVNTHRILVRGTRVATGPLADEPVSGVVGLGFPWWAVLLGGAVVGGTAVVIRPTRAAQTVR